MASYLHLEHDAYEANPQMITQTAQKRGKRGPAVVRGPVVPHQNHQNRDRVTLLEGGKFDVQVPKENLATCARTRQTRFSLERPFD